MIRIEVYLQTRCTIAVHQRHLNYSYLTEFIYINVIPAGLANSTFRRNCKIGLFGVFSSFAECSKVLDLLLRRYEALAAEDVMPAAVDTSQQHRK